MKSIAATLVGKEPRLEVDAAQLDDSAATECRRLCKLSELVIHVADGAKPRFDLCSFGSVVWVEFVGGRIDDEWMRMAARLPQVLYLVFRDCAATDAQLPLLYGCKDVRHFLFNRKSTSREGRAALKRALPDAEVD